MRAQQTLRVARAFTLRVLAGSAVLVLTLLRGKQKVSSTSESLRNRVRMFETLEADRREVSKVENILTRFWKVSEVSLSLLERVMS